MSARGFSCLSHVLPHYDVVCGVVELNGRILCVRKSETKYAYTSHRWEFPGGKIESGELPEASLRRELIEELGLEVQVLRHLLTVEHAYPDFSIRLRAYHCRPVGNELQLREHEALRWLPVEELGTLSWCDADAPIAQFLVGTTF